jgi:hypothetical protein
MTPESVPASSVSQPSSAEQSRWEVDLLELLAEIDSQVHRVMTRFIAAGDRAKSDIVAMIDEALIERTQVGDDLARELAEARAQIGAARAAPAGGQAAEAMALVDGVWSRTEAELAPIRKTVDQLHSIESTVGEILRNEQPGLTLRTRVTVLGLKSYQQAITLAHGIKDDRSIHDVSIQSYQPGRLLLLVTGTDETSIARRILIASGVPITRLPDQSESIVFQTIE